MKLSEAILLGSTMGPQAFRVAKSGDATCALGAAADAIGSVIERVWIDWPWLERRRATCPECGAEYKSIPVIIAIHLNDLHRWTRERIAEWVATIEPQETAEPVAALVEPEKVEVL